MTDLTKADAVAALRRAESMYDSLSRQWVLADERDVADEMVKSAAILNALADALEQAQDGYQLGASWHKQWESQPIMPNYWIIPAPRLP